MIRQCALGGTSLRPLDQCANAVQDDVQGRADVVTDLVRGGPVVLEHPVGQCLGQGRERLRIDE